MTPETRTTVLLALRRRHDELLERLYHRRSTVYVKHTDGGVAARRSLAADLRAVRAALRELEPSRWPTWMSRPEHAAEAYAVEGR